MKYFYYVAQSPKYSGFSQYSRLQQGEFFNWKSAKQFLIKQGVKDPICIFFKEITKEEFDAFVESFTA